MDYFEILNLQREPFSNSPEPDFFFQSDQHRGCLQKLELSIRLRRGLNVVIGDVGAGKTTLCRRLILNFSETEEDRQQIETHLILDPSFSNTQEFLSTVCLSLGILNTADGQSEWQLKENIKNYLFQKGVDEGKVIVLIIDEGQKLPDFCREILREFLNYETNQYKLLQIVIFAQKEFERTLKEHENFADRINQYLFLNPLNFINSKELIKYRLAMASANQVPPSLFTMPGLWAIYRASGGYPRKIITLCHQVILTTIIQNRSRAGFFLVRACASRVSPDNAPRWRRWALAIFGAIIAAFLIKAGYELLKTEQTTKGFPFSFYKKNAKSETQPPVMLGKLTIEKDDSMRRILERIYGSDASRRLKAVVVVNPEIEDMDKVRKGNVINIPALSQKSCPLPQSKSWVQIAVVDNLKAAYDLLTPSDDLPPSFLLSYWTEKEGVKFAVLMKEAFEDEAAALSAIRELPQPFASHARVVKDWRKGTIFL